MRTQTIHYFLSLFEIIALRNLERASFRVCTLWKLGFMRLTIYRGIHSGGMLVRKDIGSKPHSIVCILCEFVYKVAMRAGCGVSIRII